MARDLSEAIVARAVELQLAEVAHRSKRLMLSRGRVCVWASFTGVDVDHVRITMSLGGKVEDAFALRFKRNDPLAAYLSCGHVLVAQLWADGDFGACTILKACIETEPTQAAIVFKPNVDIVHALLSWVDFKARFMMQIE